MNKKIFMLLPLLFLPANFIQAQVQLSPGFKDFGEVEVGKPYACKVKVTNSSAKPVTLSAASVNSNSATVDLKKGPLAPKASVLMTLHYIPNESQKGLQVFRAVFTASFGGKKGETTVVERDFQVKASIKSSYTLSPETLIASFLNGQKATGVQGRLELDKKTGADWKFLKADAFSNSFTAHVEAFPTPLAYSVRLGVPEGLAPGTYAGKIVIEGSGKKVNTIEYPYHVVINSLFEMEPRVLQVGVLDSQRLKTWKGLTQVRRIDGKPLKINKIEGVPSWLKYDIQKASKGESYLVHWTVDTGRLQDKQEQGKPLATAVSLTTDSVVEKMVSLPLNATWSKSNTPQTFNAFSKGTPTTKKPIPLPVEKLNKIFQKTPVPASGKPQPTPVQKVSTPATKKN